MLNPLRELQDDRSRLMMLPSHLRDRALDVVKDVTVYEKEPGIGMMGFDLLSRLMKDRIVFIGEQVSDGLANYVIAQLLYLQMQDPGKDINIYINSPGGSVTAGLAMYDTMQFITCDVNTYCMGIAASIGFRAPHCRHQGQAFLSP